MPLPPQKFREAVLQILFMSDFAPPEEERIAFMMAEIKTEFGELNSRPEQAGVPVEEYIGFLLSYVDAKFRWGDQDAARIDLETVIDLQLQNQEEAARDVFKNYQIIMTRYLWWQIEGTHEFESLPLVQPVNQPANTEYRSCIEADSAARLYVIEGQRENAAREVKYLEDRGYAKPSFVRFCRKHGLCS